MHYSTVVRLAPSAMTTSAQSSVTLVISVTICWPSISSPLPQLLMKAWSQSACIHAQTSATTTSQILKLAPASIVATHALFARPNMAALKTLDSIMASKWWREAKISIHSASFHFLKWRLLVSSRRLCLALTTDVISVKLSIPPRLPTRLCCSAINASLTWTTLRQPKS